MCWQKAKVSTGGNLQKIMNKIYKAALLSVLGFAGAMTAHAQTAYNGDLIVGFTTQSGNDLVYDLGAESSLVNGESWALTSLLTGMNLSTVDWGVVGSTPPPITRTGTDYSWTTTALGAPTPASINGNTTLKDDVESPIGNIYQNFATAGAGQSLSISSSSDDSWNTETVNPNAPGDYINTYENPNVTGETSADFYQALSDNSAPTLLGTFALNSSGDLTFTATPEPSTYGLLAAGGLLFVASRKFRRQQV